MQPSGFRYSAISMKNGFLLLLLLCTFSVHAFVNPGDPVSKLIDEHGQPSGKIDRGGVTFYSYPQGVIQVKDGIIVNITDDFYGLNNTMVKTTSSGESVEYKKTPITGSSIASGDAGAFGDWWQDEKQAFKLAKEQDKPLLMLFTGSDWCVGCRLMKRDIFDNPEFKAYASNELILLKVDFPRQVELGEAVKEQNDALKNRWKIEEFPTILLLNAKGKLIERLSYSDLGAKEYVEFLKTTISDGLARQEKEAIQTAGDYMESVINDDPGVADELGLLNSFGGSIIKLSLQALMGTVLLYYIIKRIFRR
jgi:protein disulfide-isomerase